MGYDSSDPLDNVGLVFIVLLCFAILALIVFGLKRLVDKYERL